jgi:hypothetical protein
VCERVSERERVREREREFVHEGELENLVNLVRDYTDKGVCLCMHADSSIYVYMCLYTLEDIHVFV